MRFMWELSLYLKDKAMFNIHASAKLSVHQSREEQTDPTMFDGTWGRTSTRGGPV